MANSLNRRGFNATAGATLLSQSAWMRFAHANWIQTPKQIFGLMSGEVTSESAVVWGRSDVDSRMLVQWDTAASFTSPRSVMGPKVTQLTDFTAKTVLSDLPAGETIYYRVAFENDGGLSDSLQGSFRTQGDSASSSAQEDVFFAWSGDTAGQGFGINLEWGGMKIYSAIASLSPQFFIHSGDMIYADNIIEEELKLRDGTIWKNLVTPAKSHVASSLDDFRGNYLYNLMDSNVQDFHSRVPLIVQWDDHETTNNWYPQQRLQSRKDKDRYDAMEYGQQLANRAKQAFFEYTPLLPQASGERRIYRQIHRGPMCDLFVLDLRTYRGPNSNNLQTEPSEASSILGAEQLAWLKNALHKSRAVWKIICCDMPIGIPVGDSMEGKGFYEAVGNGDNGKPLGRELEFLDLLRWIKESGVSNTVWITADVHYAAAHFYDPKRSAVPDAFKPFWEFVAGPLHAGSFGPNALDGTFGPEVKFQWAPPPGSKLPLAPSDGLQSFGTIRIDAKSHRCTVELRGLDGQVLDGGSFTLEPNQDAH
jgi:alkaline phosphatase D